MKIVLIEDEPLAAKRLEGMIRAIEPKVTVLARLDSVRESVLWCNQNEAPDLIFMDVQLADGLCFEIFQETEIRSPIIFTTAYDEYALRAFKVNSIDYLLKPIDPDELRDAIVKFNAQRAPQNQEQVRPNLDQLLRTMAPPSYKNRFLLKTGTRFEVVETRDILYFYAEDKVVFIQTAANQRYLIEDTLDELEKKMDPQAFFRANRRYLTHLSAIERIEPHFNGKLALRLKYRPWEEEIFVSRDKADGFKKWLDS
ncbi:LytR/AlgR family response regulator transcription factor [Arundinibacter roseus]|uniref:Response regulator transcription factor n=1 Tax=Arundinibacter roseus TaxID=2070510 RepID=A0A4R4K4F3_9BACT|nr:LytTR family DNA-binding domain-containing protein [Arundinibacter roseus]TDB61366.1 response regulator transcription factor [Arundinibacter roseus]